MHYVQDYMNMVYFRVETETFTDLGDVHDFDGRQLSRFDMSPLVRKSKERERLKRCN